MRIHYFLVAFTFCLLVSHGLFAQKKMEAEVPFEWEKGEEGTAMIEYIENKEGEKILDGRFKYTYQQPDTSEITRFYRRDISGNYKQGEKHLDWRYQDALHNIKVNDIVNFEVNTTLQSTISRLEANYSEDVPEGPWQITVDSYQEGMKKEYPRTVSKPLLFRKGVITGPIAYYQYASDDEMLKIEGFTDNGGFMDSTWVLRYLQDSVLIEETRQYQQGILLKLTKKEMDSDSILQEVSYADSQQKLAQLNSGEDTDYQLAQQPFGLFYNDGFLPSTPKMQAQESGNKFIRDFLVNLLQYDRDEYFENNQLQKYPIRTNRFKYTLSKQKLETARSIQRTYKSLRQKIDEYADSDALALNHDRTDSLTFAYFFFRSMSEKLDTMKQLITMLGEEQLTYLDLDKLNLEEAHLLSPMDTIYYQYEGKSKMKSLTYLNTDSAEGSFLATFESFLKKHEEIADQLIAYTDQQLAQTASDRRLKEIEAKISNRFERVDSLYKQPTKLSRQEKLNQSLRSRFLVDRYGNMIMQYAQSDTPEDKKAIANQLLALLNEMEAIYPALSKVYAQWEQTDSLYMERTFNPFSYTRYNQRVKENLYEAGEELFMHYLEELRNEEDYTQLETYINRIKRLNDRLRELREEDTRKLERRLSRIDRPSLIESELDL